MEKIIFLSIMYIIFFHMGFKFGRFVERKNKENE